MNAANLMDVVLSSQAEARLDREFERQVFMNIGKPAPARRPMPTLRLTLLIILLGLVALLGLAGLAGAAAGGADALAGAQGLRGTVQKGPGGPQAGQVTPIEKLEIFPGATKPMLYNFLQLFPLNQSQVAVARPWPTSPTSAATIPDEQVKLLLVLISLLSVWLWIIVRAQRRW